MHKKILGPFILALIGLTACKKQIHEDGVLVPLTVVEDASLNSITVNSVQLHTKTYGNPTNPLLLVIHGGPGGDHTSLLNFQELADEGMYVVFYDQRGSGLSERLGKEAYSSVQVYIDELDGVIKHYRQSNDQKLILAGHSWGAMLATAYINQQPTQVNGAILIEPGGFTWDQTLAYFSGSRKMAIFDELTNDFVYQDQFISGADHNSLDYKMALATAGSENTGDPTPAVFSRYGAICNTASLNLAQTHPEQMDFTQNLSAYTTPVLFAYSEYNPAYGLSHAEKVSAAYPNVQLIEVAGCGHEIPQFGWSNFYPAVQTYLIEIL